MEICKEKGGFFAEVKGGEKASFSPACPSSFLPFYSLFLSVLVIFVHSTHFTVPALQAVPKTDFFSTSFLIKMEYLFSEFLGQIAVPGFFFLSGFLFLKGLYDLKDWARKWKSRVFSYILPYLIWNTAMTLLYLFFGKAEWSLKSIAEGMFLYRFNPVFWYFYQLILLSFCFPFMAIFAIFIRKGEEQKGYRKKSLRHLLFLFPIFFLFLIYFQLDIPFLNEDAVFYYSLGGSVAFIWEIRQCKVLSVSARVQPEVSSGAMHGVQSGVPFVTLFGVPTLSLLALSLFFFIQTLLPHAIGILLMATVLYRIGMALCFLFLFRMMDFPYERGPERKPGSRKEEVQKVDAGKWTVYALQTLSEMNFYIYAVHYLFLRPWFFLQNLLYAFLEKNSTGFLGSGKEEAVKLLFYLLSPVYCLFLAYLTGKAIKKFSPKLWKTVNGGRG